MRFPLFASLLLFTSTQLGAVACDLRADKTADSSAPGGTGNANNSGDPGTAGGNAGGNANSSNANSGNANTPATTTLAPQIRTIGRVFSTTTGGRLTLSWPGTALQFSTRASALKVSWNVTSDPSSSAAATGIVTLIDGVVSGTKVVLSAGQSDMTVPGLDGSLHVVTLIKSSEAQAGDLQYVGVSGGALEASTQAAPSRLIEFIGDSISAGFGVDGPVGNTNSCSTSAHPLGGADGLYSNAALAHPVLVAQALNADWSVVAYSGKGIFRNYTSTDASTMPMLWPLSSPDLGLAWPVGSQKPSPDAVVINLGTNDFNRKDSLDDTAFVATYASFLQTVRKAYPSAHILVAVPMLSDSVLMGDGQKQLSEATTDIQNAVAQSQLSKISIVKLVASDNLSCDGHPDVAGQKLIAAQVQKALQSLTGW